MHDELRKLLKDHDWFYEWSDSSKAHARGHAQRQEIFALLGLLRGIEGMPLIAEFCPEKVFMPFMNQFTMYAKLKKQNLQR